MKISNYKQIKLSKLKKWYLKLWNKKIFKEFKFEKCNIKELIFVKDHRSDKDAKNRSDRKALKRKNILSKTVYWSNEVFRVWITCGFKANLKICFSSWHHHSFKTSCMKRIKVARANHILELDEFFESSDS